MKHVQKYHPKLPRDFDWFGPNVLQALVFILQNTMRKQPSTMRAIHEHICPNKHVHPNYTNHIVKALENRGLVRRDREGRKKTITLGNCLFEILDPQALAKLGVEPCPEAARPSAMDAGELKPPILAKSATSASNAAKAQSRKSDSRKVAGVDLLKPRTTPRKPRRQAKNPESGSAK